jgi:hypothetical protein
MAKFSRSAERELIGNGKSVPTQLLMIMTGKSLERLALKKIGVSV